jgi:hypothetical protein
MGVVRPWAVCLVALTAAAGTTVIAQPRPAVPLEPITAILDLFKDYRLVGLGEGPHNNIEAHRFRLSLIRHRRFSTIVNDIVVESGSARYQDVMDGYVNGQEVPYAELRRVWEDTTSPNTAFDKPIYEEFYAAVRSVNRMLPKDRRIRVLLGEPPIAWESIKQPSDLQRWWSQRDAHAVAVIKREVLAKNRRALVVYGDGHFQGRGFAPLSITVRLEREGEKFFTVSTSFVDLRRFQPDVAQWKAPAFAHLKDTVIGTQFYARFYPLPPRPGWNTVLMQDQFDGILYMGTTKPTMSMLPKRRCDDPAYMRMRLARLAMAPDQRAQPAEQLRRYCDGLER